MAIREKVCVILGAGASFDVRDQRTSQDRDLFQPPLAAGIFNTSNREFDTILNRYPGARFIANVFPDQLSQGKTFEEALSYYADHSVESIKSHFYQVPPYLHDLLTACSNSYTPDQGCYVRIIMELLVERSFDVLFLVLNYDDLLEKALFKYDPKLYSFQSMEDYVRPGRAANVVKMHGSINWYRPMTQSPNTPWLDLVGQDSNLRHRPQDSEIIVINYVGEVKEYPHDGHWLYPILTAPVAVKTATEIACPGSHTVFAEDFLSSCRRFLVLGSSGSDADLFDILERSTGGWPATVVHFVGKGSETQESLSRFQNGMGIFPSAATTLFTDGLKHYVNNYLQSFSE